LVASRSIGEKVIVVPFQVNTPGTAGLSTKPASTSPEFTGSLKVIRMAVPELTPDAKVAACV
jgi:hypothetical protein